MDLGRLVELSERRICPVCLAIFWTERDRSALQRIAEHLIEHQPSPEQWAVAYQRIQERKTKKSFSEKVAKG
jgi:hypothetical protein